MTLREFRAKKAGLVEQIRSLKTANPNMTPEVQSQIDALFIQVDAVSSEIASEERLAGHESELRESAGRVPRDTPSAPAVITRTAVTTRSAAVKRTNSDEYKDALADYAFRGRDMSSASQNVLSDAEVRALSFGTNTAGGYTVPTGFIDNLVIAQKSWGQFLNVCDYLDTDQGNPMQYPLSNDTAQGGEISAEAGAIAVTGMDPVFSQVTLTPDKWDSGVVKVSYELLQDSAFNIDSLLEKFFAVRMARKLNNLVTLGSATGNIQGLVGTAPSDSIAPPSGATSAAPTAVSLADLNALFYSIDAAYRTNGVWIFNSATMQLLSGIQDTLGRPILQESFSNADVVTLKGRPIVINEDMPNVAALAKAIAFGDPKSYLVRRVGTPTLLRINELYAVNGQVGFMLYGRAAGRVLDGGTHPIKVLTQHA
jgi:HK97 family phage major capsid protein